MWESQWSGHFSLGGAFEGIDYQSFLREVKYTKGWGKVICADLTPSSLLPF